MMKEFRSIVIDADSNTYTIKDGTQGEYKLSEIKKYFQKKLDLLKKIRYNN